MATFSSMQLLQGYLQLTERQQQIVSNMANVDTPGYHTKDVDFQAAMRQVMNGDPDLQLQPVSQEEFGLTERPDGNNVNIDRESLLLSQTQLQYQMGVQLIKSEFHKLLTAIKEGAKPWAFLTC
jgi:flagellar basal-body rod protein FlgB